MIDKKSAEFTEFNKLFSWIWLFEPWIFILLWLLNNKLSLQIYLLNLIQLLIHFLLYKYSLIPHFFDMIKDISRIASIGTTPHPSYLEGKRKYHYENKFLKSFNSKIANLVKLYWILSIIFFLIGHFLQMYILYFPKSFYLKLNNFKIKLIFSINKLSHL